MAVLRRITRISRKADRPSEADIEISDALSQTSQSSMQKSIADVRHEVRTESTAFPDLIRSWDNTLPTDNNLFSARHTLREALSKKYSDSAAGLIKFLGGAEFGEYESGESGAKITPAGEAEFADAVIRRMLRSPVFTDGFTGEGFKLGEDETGLTSLSIDRLTVRQTMAVMELLVNKVRATGGGINVTGCKIKIAGENPANGIRFIYRHNGPLRITPVPATAILVNDPKKLSFIAPVELIAGDYKMSITTQYAGTSTLLKEPRTCVFEQILAVQ